MHETLISTKKTCTPKVLLQTLSAIHTFSYGEGEGGQSGYGRGDGYPGTELRHPDMPLYNLPKNQRHSILKHLEEKKLIVIENKDDPDQWSKFKLTNLGKTILLEEDRCEECNHQFEWYYTHGFTQTGPTSGYKHDGRTRLCECGRMKYEALARQSGCSNNRFGIGEKIKSEEQ